MFFEVLLFMLKLTVSQLINCLLCNMMLWKAFVKKYGSLLQNVTISNAIKSLSLTKA